MMFKTFLKNIIPTSIKTYIVKHMSVKLNKDRLIKSFKYDYEQYNKYSENPLNLSKDNLIGLITRQYHIIEKGLTMPSPRLGFGKANIKDLIKNCSEFKRKYEKGNDQVSHAIKVVFEYLAYHEQEKFTISSDLINEIENLKNLYPEFEQTQQFSFTKEQFFKHVGADFYNFSFSRHSVRNFSKTEVPLEKIEEALEIAQNAPSACNRQTWRVCVFSDKKIISNILDLQGGSRGFGNLANKLILITSDVSYYAGPNERNSAFVDGGIYSMNLLYALHYKEVACCILNCSFASDKDIQMRKITGVKESEVFISIIICGIPPNKFKVALSMRSDYKLKRFFK